MNEPDAQAGGIADRLRRMVGSLLALLRGRAELFVVEFQQEKLRLLTLALWLGLALTLGVAGLLVATAALAIWLWESAGYTGLVSLAAITLGAAAGLFWWIREMILNGAAPFPGTITEFRKDGEWLRKNQ